MTQPFIQEEITEEDFVFFNKKEGDLVLLSNRYDRIHKI